MPSLPSKSTRLMVRLARYGCTNRPFFHIVLIPNRSPRNGRIVEQLGTYDPMPNLSNERLLAINFERLRKWIADGVWISKPVEELLGIAGFYPIHPMSYIKAGRQRKSLAAQQEKDSAANTDAS